MRCRRVPSGHWVGVLTLLFGLCLSAAGVLSPWWRMVNDHSCSRFEGLWQQCYRCWHSRTHCSFSERSTGLWRAIQIAQLLSLLCLTGGLLCSLTCADKRRCTRGKCPIPSLAAATGGVAGMLANLMFVGYIERYVQHAPREHVYAWSFAMAVAGSLLSILASLIFSISKAVCMPRYSSQAAEPYWPYNHYGIGLDPSGCPHHFPYPCLYPVVHVDPSAELNLTAAPSASEKRKLFESYRHGRVEIHTKEEKVPNDTGCPMYCSKLHGDFEKCGKCVALKEKPTEEKPPGDVQNTANPREGQGIQQHIGGSNTENQMESSAPKIERHPQEKSRDPVMTGSDMNSLPQDSEPLSQCEQQNPGPPGLMLPTTVPGHQHSCQVMEEEQRPIFTVEAAFRDSCATGDLKGGQDQQDDNANLQTSTSSRSLPI